MSKSKYIFEGREFSRPLTDVQKVIEHFVTVFVSSKNNVTFWKTESKFARDLIKKYNIDFLLKTPPPSGYKVGSLMFFLTPSGKNYLVEQKFEYAKANGHLVKEKEEITLSESKIGEDLQVRKKPKTLKDFLNYGKKDTGQ